MLTTKICIFCSEPFCLDESKICCNKCFYAYTSEEIKTIFESFKQNNNYDDECNKAKVRNCTTDLQVKLYLVLKSIGLNVKIEHFDTRKTVDIAIHKEGQPILLIEVDGEQHSSDYEQVRKDIWRSYGSFIESSLFTLHIPNVQLEEDVIYQICSEILGVFKNLLIRDLKQLIETRKQAETEYKKLVGFIQPFTRINVPS